MTTQPVDLPATALVSRTELGLPDLDINDHVNFYLGPTVFGANVAWNRNQITSPFLDGAVTTYRTRQMVTETIVIECLGPDSVAVVANAKALIAAFCQDSFTVGITLGTTTLAQFVYHCEAADYQVVWTGPRWMANQLQVTLQVPRRPEPLAGI